MSPLKRLSTRIRFPRLHPPIAAFRRLSLDFSVLLAQRDNRVHAGLLFSIRIPFPNRLQPTESQKKKATLFYISVESIRRCVRLGTCNTTLPLQPKTLEIEVSNIDAAIASKIENSELNQELKEAV